MENLSDQTNQKITEVNQSELKNFGEFSKEPRFADLWDKCVYNLLYDPEKFTEEFSQLLAEYGVDKSSKILDTCAGSGFPALDMYKNGYSEVFVVDGFDDAVALFNEKAEEAGLDIRSERCTFKELAKHFEAEQFKALICRGTIWYAEEGGWNQDFIPSRDGALKAVRDAIATFHSLLETGGVLYVDKFKDTEVPHKDTVGTFKVAGKEKELIFCTQLDRDTDIRRAHMITKDVETEEETFKPNVTYNLKEEELEQILQEVGFSIVKPDLVEEKFFTSWLAIKN